MELILDPIYIVNLLLSLIIVLGGLYAYFTSKNRIMLYIIFGFFGFGLTHLFLIMGLASDYELYIVAIRTISYLIIIIGLYFIWKNLDTHLKALSNKNKQLDTEIDNHKRTEEWLQLSEQRYRVIFEKTLTPLAIIEDDMTISLVNSQFVSFVGYPKDAIEGHIKITDFLTSDEREKMIKSRIGRKNEYRFVHDNYECHFIDRHGRLKTVLYSVAVIPETRKSLVSLVDMTERNRAEDVMKKYALVFKSVRDIILFLQTDGTIVEANDTAISSYGYTRDELLSMNGEDLRAPEERPYLLNQLKQSYQDGCLYETIHIRKDGSRFPVEINSSGMEIGDRKLLVCAIRDTTERMNVENALRTTQYAIDRSSEIVFWIKPDSRFYYVNNTACEKLGYTKDELLSLSIPDIDIDPRFNHENWPAHWKQLKESGAMTFESGYRTKSGRIFPVEVSINYLEFGGREFDFAFVRDITKRKMAEDALRVAKSDAELYLDLMGHDISNMNQIALGYLELTLDSPDIDEKSKELLKKPVESLKDSAKLIENVRKLQRAKANDSRTVEIDIGRMIEKLVHQYDKVPGREVTINYSPASGYIIKANGLIEDVFMNVIVNSIKHSTGPLTIWISLDSERIGALEYYRAIIEDNGPGIPDDLKDKVFNRLQRGTTKSNGSGLGLHLVKTLVESMGGSVKVEDRVPGDPGKGSKFIIMLPASGDWAQKAEKVKSLT